jgi:hypothetical protein
VSNQPVAAAPVATPSPTDSGAISPQLLQSVIDRASHFNMFSMPDPALANPVICASGSSGSVIGMNVCERLHRFRISVHPPSPGKPMTASNAVGEEAGRFTHRWMLAPDDWAAAPGREPPPTPLDPTRSQRLVMLDSLCKFGHGDDGFRGFGAGQTIVGGPANGRGQLLITAVGTILEGFGKFKGHEQGTYVYCGALTPKKGFMGNVLLRVMDPQSDLTTESELRSFDEDLNPEPNVTYLVFRGQAVPSDPVSPRIGPDGKPNGLVVVQGLRLLDLDFKSRGPGGVQSTAKVGRSIGKITASVTFNPAAPGGSNLDPIPFLADDEFVLSGRDGTPDSGSFRANSTEGRVFKTLLLGQPGIRFGGTGLILSGAGPYQGITGLMTDNSVVAFTPHVSASVYMLRIDDPQCKFRAGAREWRKT